MFVMHVRFVLSFLLFFSVCVVVYPFLVCVIAVVVCVSIVCLLFVCMCCVVCLLCSCAFIR